MNQKQPTDAYKYSAERESRVAAALRENLRKRKAQQQSRTDSNAPNSTEE
jgi:cytochrome c-type biogenesis protein CcmH/NrfF